MAHMGASSGEIETRPRMARCIYSGKERMYEVLGTRWTADRQAELNQKFMNKDCDCAFCAQKRKDRLKLAEALRRDHDTAGLRLLGL